MGILRCWFMMALLFTIKAAAQLPLPNNVLTTLQQQHPRLLIKSIDEFAQLKLRISTDTFLQQCEKNIVEEAETISTQPVCTYIIPDGLRLLETSRKVLNRSYVLSMAFRLTSNKMYSERLWKELLAAAQFPDWNPRHFLDAAEMTHAFAIAYDWLFDVWTPSQKQVLKQAIMEKGLLRAKMHYNHLIAPGTYAVDFPQTTSNWNSVCNGGITMGALAIAESEPLLANEIIKNAIKSVPIALQEFAPDGGFTEGPTYWGYAMRYNVAMMASLESALGTDFGLSKLPGLAETGNFPIAMNGATGYPYQYADAWPNIINSPTFFWLANKFNKPLYSDYVKTISNKSVLDLLWYRSSESKAASLPLDNYFTRVNVASLRSAWNDKNAWFVGIKGGYNQDSHCHLDLGSFILEKNNIRWLIDLGVDSYTLPGYFDKKLQRWTYYRTRAEGHNTIVINPDSNPDQNLFGKAPIINFKSAEQKSFAIVDLADAYEGKVTSAKRGIALIDKQCVLVQDEITALKPCELYWFVHTHAAIGLSEKRNKATLQKDGKTLEAEIVSPKGAVFDIMEPILLKSSTPSAGNNPNTGIRKLAIHFTNVSTTTISVVFKEKNGKAKITGKKLSEW